MERVLPELSDAEVEPEERHLGAALICSDTVMRLVTSDLSSDLVTMAT
jgi:hypothetical protein